MKCDRNKLLLLLVYMLRINMLGYDNGVAQVGGALPLAHFLGHAAAPPTTNY